MKAIELAELGSNVALVTINRPQRRNACNTEVWQQLEAVFNILASDKRLRGIVLEGAGGHFTAGDDIIEYALLRDDEAAAKDYAQQILRTYIAIRSCSVPVIAAISGYCIGAGCGLAMCCDFRIAHRGAKIGIPAAKLALMYPTEQCQRLASLIGIQNTRRWLYSGEIFFADRAKEMGFIDDLVTENPRMAALTYIHSMLGSGPLAIAGTKLQLNALAVGIAPQDLDSINSAMTMVENSKDAREAASAFREKRPPNFLGY